MDRQVFYDLGTYDQEMRIYGGEEMEIGVYTSISKHCVYFRAF